MVDVTEEAVLVDDVGEDEDSNEVDDDDDDPENDVACMAVTNPNLIGWT